jgi:hypothetical protein
MKFASLLRTPKVAQDEAFEIISTKDKDASENVLIIIAVMAKDCALGSLVFRSLVFRSVSDLIQPF